MDRPIVYTQEQGRSTDFLFGQRAAMVGLGKLIEAAFGTGTLVAGLSVVPTAPASMSVWVNPGQIFAVEPLDATAYGVLTADTTHSIVKQGLLMDQSALSCPAPGTPGFSINYLIQATYQDSDTTNVVLPYFNSANPTQPLTGQNNSGAAQPTERQGLCIVAVKAGAAAATSTQTTPAPDAGYVGLAVVTVANGAATIVAGNIAIYGSAPYITETLTQKISQATGDARYVLLSSGTNQSNIIINGNFPINQRAVSGAVVLAAGQYGHDRWKAGAGGCSYTFATANGVTTLTISAGSLQQVVEGTTLLSGTYTLSWTGTCQGKIGAGAYAASGVSGAVTGGANLTIEFGTGTLSLVQFSPGTVASAFNNRLIEQELELCQRYYEKLTFGPLTTRAYLIQANDIYGSEAQFKVKKRAVPTSTLIGTANTDYAVANLAGTLQAGFTFATVPSLTGVGVHGTKAGHGLADAVINFTDGVGFVACDAEL